MSLARGEPNGALERVRCTVAVHGGEQGGEIVHGVVDDAGRARRRQDVVAYAGVPSGLAGDTSARAGSSGGFSRGWVRLMDRTAARCRVGGGSCQRASKESMNYVVRRGAQ
ncbi:hypothetical protein GCM10010274_63410 [Streptomyces lavendofoliae]|uniref:Uncharacterized protein n=1 Tax=Streptomyces lavendofoliae TaxID=67314 RepID=A0A918I452_9ACTN|nr:hypothetical protein GCM10010274_63410 [Streptomyces lavendofoliae]